MKNKFSIAMSLAVILAMLLTSVGLADNINNDIAAHVGSDNISVGGFTTVGYKVVASGGDNQTGCNAIDGSPLNLTINVPTNVSASGATLLAGNKLKFTTCGDFQYVTYTSNVAADYPITTSYSDTGTGTYNDNADFTLHVTGSSDTTAPVLSLPSNITTESTGSSGAVVNFTATANDAVDGSVAVTCVPASGSTFAIGTATVTCSATDAAGNTGTGSFTVKVQDTTAPVVTVPANISTSATSISGAVVTYTATAHEIVDGSVLVTCNPASGSTFAPGSTTVNCSATEAAGNTGTGSFTISVTFNFSGFLGPVNNPNTVNTGKAGRTYPVKWQLPNGSGGYISDLSAVKSITYKPNTCGAFTGDPSDSLETSVTGGTSLRYDSTANQFVYNWATPGTGCYTLFLTLNDGKTWYAFFSLTK